MTWQGRLYEGGFRDGKPYGYGVFITPDGQQFEGETMGRVVASVSPLAVSCGRRDPKARRMCG